MNRKAVIFDFDGVLIDTGEFHRQSWYDMGKLEGFEITAKFFYDTFGMQNYQIIPMLLGKDVTAEKIESLANRKEEHFRELIAGKLCLLEGVRPFVESVKQAGFLLAIGSSAPRANVEFMLKELPISDYFDAVVAGEDVRNGKPAPDTFALAAKKLGIDSKDCVVIEDAPVGVEAARNAGMKVVAVTTTADRYKLSRADLIADSLDELTAKDIIKLLEKNDRPIPAIQ